MVQRRKLDHLPDRFPLACQWEVTCRCNLHCVMCYTDCFNEPERIRQELPTVDLLRIMDDIAEAGCLELCLTGGEPLARPDFFQIYERAINLGFLVTLFTNGTLITESIADRLAAHPPHRIEISMHGLTETTFEQVTLGRGSFTDANRPLPCSLTARPLTLKSTAMTLNQHELLSIKRYVEIIGSVRYKLGEEIRPALDGPALPFSSPFNRRPSTNSIGKTLSSGVRPATADDRTQVPAAAGCDASTSTPTVFSNCAPAIALKATIY